MPLRAVSSASARLAGVPSWLGLIAFHGESTVSIRRTASARASAVSISPSVMRPRFSASGSER